MVNKYLCTFFCQKLTPALLKSVEEREMTTENISWSISMKEHFLTWRGSNLQPPVGRAPDWVPEVCHPLYFDNKLVNNKTVIYPVFTRKQALTFYMYMNLLIIMKTYVRATQEKIREKKKEIMSSAAVVIGTLTIITPWANLADKETICMKCQSLV